MKGETAYLEYRRLNDGRIIAVDWLPQGRGTVVIGTHHGQCSWEYHSITAALWAWLIWEPSKSAEPAGYEKRRTS